MNVNVLTASGGPSAELFVREMTRRVEFDLKRFDGRIGKLDVVVIDIDDGHKGCVFEAELPDSAPITVRAHAGTFETAIDKGADKLERVIEFRINHLEPINFSDREQDLLNPSWDEDDEEPRAI